MPKNEITLTLRLPAEVHKLLVEKCAAESRSLNGQVVHVIKAYLGRAA